MIFKNRLLTCILDEAGGMVGATPESMGHQILLSVKMTLNARINMFRGNFISLHSLFYIL